MSVRPQIAFFNQIDKNDIPLVGGKGANLGEMTQAGFPVPNGFAITVESYDIFLAKNDISHKLNDTLKGIDINSSDELQEASRKIDRLITSRSEERRVGKEGR